MTKLPITVVNHLGGWRIRHPGGVTRKYKSQGDAIKVALEIARYSPERPQVLLQTDEATFQPIPGARAIEAVTFFTDTEKESPGQNVGTMPSLAG